MRGYGDELGNLPAEAGKDLAGAGPAVSFRMAVKALSFGSALIRASLGNIQVTIAKHVQVCTG